MAFIPQIDELVLECLVPRREWGHRGSSAGLQVWKQPVYLGAQPLCLSAVPYYSAAMQVAFFWPLQSFLSLSLCLHLLLTSFSLIKRFSVKLT